MKLNKNFLHKEPNFFEISRFKLIVGILIGLLYSFALYSFLNVSRELFRILSVSENYDLWILTDNQVNFYNLFFAFISVIFGQSICFVFWLDRPKKMFQKQNYRKTTIVNDQRVLNWNFLNWFSRLAALSGLWFGLTIQGGYYIFSLYPDYNYIFILIIIVLFFQTWNTIRFTYKRNSLKWLLYSIVIVSLVSFGLSKLNLIDYKTINQKFFQKNITYNYNLELPKTDCYKKIDRHSLVENIYVVKSKNPDSAKPIIIVNNKEIVLQQLNDVIYNWQSMWRESEIPLMIYKLHIDKSVKMDFVNKLKNELTKSGITKIAYAVIPKNPKYDTRYYKDSSFPIKIINWHSKLFVPQEVYDGLNRFQNIIVIKQNTSGTCFINDKPVENDKIKKTIKDLITNNSDYMIKFSVNDSMKFSDYFRVISYSKEVIDELRNEYSNEKYAKQFNMLKYEDIIKVKNKFPFRIFELTTEFMKMINKK